jgi:hypothetical protein
MEQELLTPPTISSYLNMDPIPRFHLLTMLVSPEKQDPKKRSSAHDFYLVTNDPPKDSLWHVPDQPAKYCIAHIISNDCSSRTFERRNLRDCMLAFNHQVVTGYPHYEVHSSPLFKTLLKLYGLEGR